MVIHYMQLILQALIFCLNGLRASKLESRYNNGNAEYNPPSSGQDSLQGRFPSVCNPLYNKWRKIHVAFSIP